MINYYIYHSNKKTKAYCCESGQGKEMAGCVLAQ